MSTIAKRPFAIGQRLERPAPGVQAFYMHTVGTRLGGDGGQAQIDIVVSERFAAKLDGWNVLRYGV